jgi:hypothetical protein
LRPHHASALRGGPNCPIMAMPAVCEPADANPRITRRCTERRVLLESAVSMCMPRRLVRRAASERCPAAIRPGWLARAVTFSVTICTSWSLQIGTPGNSLFVPLQWQREYEHPPEPFFKRIRPAENIPIRPAFPLASHSHPQRLHAYYCFPPNKRPRRTWPPLTTLSRTLCRPT